MLYVHLAALVNVYYKYIKYACSSQFQNNFILVHQKPRTYQRNIPMLAHV